MRLALGLEPVTGMRTQAERDVRGALLLDKIAEAEKVEVTSEEVDEEIGKMAEYYRNEGNATPLATLQTFAWACDRGDIEAVQRPDKVISEWVVASYRQGTQELKIEN